MTLEGLANELLLELFEYLPAVDLLRTFHNLNTRFNTLLFTHFRAYHFDFRSVSKRNFDTICQQHLPLIVDRILSLRLSDDDKTPHQIDYFFSCRLTLRQLAHLRSLTLYHLRSTVIMNTLMIECHHLPQLTHLDFIECSFQDDHQSIFELVNNIWSLTRLTHCHLDIHFERQIYIIVPPMISTSLQYLSIESYCYGLNEVVRLFQYTPYLRHLCILFRDHSVDQPLSFTIPSIITLKLSIYESSSSTMTNLLKNMPNLCYLTVETDEVNMNGHQWERIIVDHLLKLKVFRLKMIFRLNDNENKEQRADELLDSFRTRFWLDERQWYVRCDWDRCEQCDKNNIYLYTLPYAFNDYFFHDSNFKSKSTCRQDDNSSSYDHVHTLGYELIPSSNQVWSHFRFSNLCSLDLHLPFDHNFLYIIPNFDQLISLRVAPYHADHDLDPLCQLQALLDRAPRLKTLTFMNWSSSSNQMPPYEYSHQSIRQLDLKDVARWYNHQHCAALSRSPLGIQCEVLSIAVETRTSILALIDTMANLRALNVACRDDTWKENDDDDDSQSLSTEDEFVNWFKHRLPSTCTITTNDDHIHNNRSKSFKSIRLWIR